MKNNYVKPEIDFEEFNFSDSIATGGVPGEDYGTYNSDENFVSSDFIDEGEWKDPWD